MDIVVTLRPFTPELEVDLSKPAFEIPLFSGIRGGPGPRGKSNYEIWLEIPGNQGKTELEFTQETGSAPVWAEAQW